MAPPKKPAGREYGKLMVKVWDPDSDFRLLASGAQRLYAMFCSLRSCSPAGCLPLQPRKWAQNAPDTTVDEIQAALDLLVLERYVFVDEDTEEVLIRTFIKSDGWAKNPNKAKAVESAIARIESPTLRQLAREALNAERQVTGSDEEPPEGSGKDSSEGNPEDHPEVTTTTTDNNNRNDQQQQQRLAAALDAHLDWKSTLPRGVDDRAAFRSKLWTDHGDQLRTYERLHPDCTHIDLAVEVLGMERPRPTLVPRAACTNPECWNGNLPSDPYNEDQRRHTTAVPCPDCNPLARASGGSL
jgi:hypothetical protein